MEAEVQQLKRRVGRGAQSVPFARLDHQTVEALQPHTPSSHRRRSATDDDDEDLRHVRMRVRRGAAPGRQSDVRELKHPGRLTGAYQHTFAKLRIMGDRFEWPPDRPNVDHREPPERESKTVCPAATSTETRKNAGNSPAGSACRSQSGIVVGSKYSTCTSRRPFVMPPQNRVR